MLDNQALPWHWLAILNMGDHIHTDVFIITHVRLLLLADLQGFRLPVIKECSIARLASTLSGSLKQSHIFTLVVFGFHV